MDAAQIIERRLRSNRLTAPASSVSEAASHMLATQAQEFWGARWALAQRTRGRVLLSEVDAAFDRGEIVRSWTMRGTIHAIAARDLGWVLALTGERQRRAAAPRHRELGLDADDFAKAERAVRRALAGGNRLTRADLFSLLLNVGVDPVGQRGYHVLNALSVRAVVCQGPVVARDSGPTREQHIVLTEEWVTEPATPSEPLADYFVRFIAGHGPAGARDFAWWSGLTLGDARNAEAAAAERLAAVGETSAAKPEAMYVAAGSAPRQSSAASAVLALPPFEEYYIPYVDRTLVCAPEFVKRVGPGANGMVRPIIVAHGRIVGVWTHSLAAGRHHDDPLPELFAPDAATDVDVAAALARYRAFIVG